MLAEQIARRLHNVAVVPAIQACLQEMVAQDTHAERHTWRDIIPTISHMLGATEISQVQPFASAWELLYAALRHLDHLQDGDACDYPLPTTASVGAQYNLLLSYYLLAATLLDELDPHTIPALRLLRLRRLWSDCLLRVASGQQADLESVQEACGGLAALEQYQQVVQAKTGALFALAFGGTAILTTDNRDTIRILSFVGEVYGMLVQYSDDVLDSAIQVNPSITLPRAYAESRTKHHGCLPDHDMVAFWQHIYQAYINQVEAALAGLPAQIQSGIRQLFATTFEDTQHDEVGA